MGEPVFSTLSTKFGMRVGLSRALSILFWLGVVAGLVTGILAADQWFWSILIPVIYAGTFWAVIVVFCLLTTVTCIIRRRTEPEAEA